MDEHKERMARHNALVARTAQKATQRRRRKAREDFLARARAEFPLPRAAIAKAEKGVRRARNT